MFVYCIMENFISKCKRCFFNKDGLDSDFLQPGSTVYPACADIWLRAGISQLDNAAGIVWPNLSILFLLCFQLTYIPAGCISFLQVQWRSIKYSVPCRTHCCNTVIQIDFPPPLPYMLPLPSYQPARYCCTVHNSRLNRMGGEGGTGKKTLTNNGTV